MSMAYVIGEKNIFAIEFSLNKLTPYAMGHICLWLNNYCLGYLPEEVMLDCSLGSLIELVSEERQKILIDTDVPNLDNENLLNLLRNDEGDLKDNTLFNVDESTDDFVIHVYRKN